MPSNTALWLAEKRRGWQVGSPPYMHPRDNEIAIRNHAVAVNPIDWLKLLIGDIIRTWVKYPFILGSDVAGEVVEVGSAVSRFQVGGRVLAHAVGADKTRNSSAEGAFRNYTVVLDHMAAPIPATMEYESAVVLPLAISTAAYGLFQKDQLAIQHPTANPKPMSKTVIVWGGSTSVGSNAIQLAVAAGYDVVTTALPSNFDYVLSLGARHAFDYRERDVVPQLIRTIRNTTIAGALAIGPGSVTSCFDVVHECKGDKVVSIATQSVSFDEAPAGSTRPLWLIPANGRLMASIVMTAAKSRMRRIRTGMIFGTTLINNEVGPMIYRDFLASALASGADLAAPEAMVRGRGLEEIPTTMEIQKKGVSARKVVVSL